MVDCLRHCISLIPKPAALKAAEQEARQKEAEEKAARVARDRAEKEAANKLARELAERLAEEEKAKKKKAIRYPIEDLDVQITERDKKAGMRTRKPTPRRASDVLPFSEVKGAFENFLTVWNFLVCFGSALFL